MNSKSPFLITFFPYLHLYLLYFSLYPLYYSIKVQLSIDQSKNITCSSLPLLSPVSRRMSHCIYTDPSLLTVQTLLVLHILPTTTLTSFPLFFPHNRNSVSLDCSVRQEGSCAFMLLDHSATAWGSTLSRTYADGK